MRVHNRKAILRALEDNCPRTKVEMLKLEEAGVMTMVIERGVLKLKNIQPQYQALVQDLVDKGPLRPRQSKYNFAMDGKGQPYEKRP